MFNIPQMQLGIVLYSYWTASSWNVWKTNIRQAKE